MKNNSLFSIDTIEQESDNEIKQFLEEYETESMKLMWNILDIREEEFELTI